MKRRGRTIACIAAAVALGFAACGHFASSTSGVGTTTTASDEIGAGEIGAGLSIPTLPSTTAPLRSTTTTASRCPNTDPSSEVRYEEWSMTVAFKVSEVCPKHSDDLEFTMTVTNTGAAPKHYDVNQIQFFTIKAPAGQPKHRWTDTDCIPRGGGDPRPAATIGPGVTMTFTGSYPGPRGATDREKCRSLDAGPYDASGVFLLCEGPAYADGYCNIDKDVQLFSQPVRLILDA